MVNFEKTSVENGAAVHVVECEVWDPENRKPRTVDMSEEITDTDSRVLRRLENIRRHPYLLILGLMKRRNTLWTREG